MAEEMIDVVTPQGVYTGVTNPKSQVHADGDWHVCVHGIITDGRGNILTQLRGPDVKLMRNVWDLIGVAGHISAFTGDPAERDLIQQAIDALIREFAEEIGEDLPRDIFFTDDCFMIGITRTDQQTEDGWRDRTLSVNFVIVMPDLDPHTLRLEPGKVLKVAWQPIDEVEAALTGQADTRFARFAVREPDQDLLISTAMNAVRWVATR